MSALSNETSAIAEATGRPWAQWIELFHQADATNLHRNELAPLALTLMPASVVEPEKWAESIASAFERDAARRRPGQGENGTFQGFVTRTLDTDLDGAMQLWRQAVEQLEIFNGQSMTQAPQLDSSQRWRYWLAGFSDDTQAQVDISLRGSKSVIAINITNAQSMQIVSDWKNFWRQILSQIKP